MFRYNNRKNLNDAQRFDLAVSQIVGKRITFGQLIGSEIEQRPPRHGPLDGKAEVKRTIRWSAFYLLFFAATPFPASLIPCERP